MRGFGVTAKSARPPRGKGGTTGYRLRPHFGFGGGELVLRREGKKFGHDRIKNGKVPLIYHNGAKQTSVILFPVDSTLKKNGLRLVIQKIRRRNSRIYTAG